MKTAPSGETRVMFVGSVPGRHRFVPVVLNVGFGCLGGVVGGVVQVALRRVRVVGGRLVVAGFMMLGGFAMVRRRMLVVFGCLKMVLRCLFRHADLLNCCWITELPRGMSVVPACYRSVSEG